MIQTFSATFWKRVLEATVITFVVTYSTQLASLQDAILNRDWSAAKGLAYSLALALLVGVAKAAWLAYVSAKDNRATKKAEAEEAARVEAAPKPRRPRTRRETK